MSLINVGDILYGYCDGYFGRDSYEEKIILHFGKDYIVVREKYSNQVLVANLDENINEPEVRKMIEKWKREEEGWQKSVRER